MPTILTEIRYKLRIGEFSEERSSLVLHNPKENPFVKFAEYLNKKLGPGQFTDCKIITFDKGPIIEVIHRRNIRNLEFFLMENVLPDICINYNPADILESPALSNWR